MNEGNRIARVTHLPSGTGARLITLVPRAHSAPYACSDPLPPLVRATALGSHDGPPGPCAFRTPATATRATPAPCAVGPLTPSALPEDNTSNEVGSVEENDLRWTPRSYRNRLASPVLDKFPRLMALDPAVLFNRSYPPWHARAGKSRFAEEPS